MTPERRTTLRTLACCVANQREAVTKAQDRLAFVLTRYNAALAAASPEEHAYLVSVLEEVQRK